MMTRGLNRSTSCTWREVNPARYRHHGAAETFGPAVEAEAAGEQAVAVGDLHQNRRTARPPARIDRAMTSAHMSRSARV